MARDNPKLTGFRTHPGRGWSAGTHRPPATRGWLLAREGRHSGAADCPRPRPGRTQRKKGGWCLKGPGSQRKWSARSGKAPGGEGLDWPHPALSWPGPRGAPHLPSQNQLREGSGAGGRRPAHAPPSPPAVTGAITLFTALRCRRLPTRPRIVLAAPLSSSASLLRLTAGSILASAPGNRGRGQLPLGTSQGFSHAASIPFTPGRLGKPSAPCNASHQRHSPGCRCRGPESLKTGTFSTPCKTSTAVYCLSTLLLANAITPAPQIPGLPLFPRSLPRPAGVLSYPQLDTSITCLKPPRPLRYQEVFAARKPLPSSPLRFILSRKLPLKLWIKIQVLG